MWDKQLNDYVIEELAKVYIEYDKKGKSEKEFKIHNINEIVVDFEYAKKHDFLFSIDIPTMKQISQGNSGRCWIFAGLNFLREYAAKRNNIKEFDFSQSYIAFWDKAERSNFFLERVIETAAQPYDSYEVRTIFRYVIVDGGYWTNLKSLIKKYGLVPGEVMPETYQSANTEAMNNILNFYLRKRGIEIRNSFNEGASIDKLYETKIEVLKSVYRFLCQCYSVPPTKFDFESQKNLTPNAFCNNMIGNALEEYIDVISLPFNKTPYNQPCIVSNSYIVIGTGNVRFLNMEFHKMKKLILKQLLDGETVFCSVDDSKMCIDELQIWDDKSFRYKELLGLEFEMNRKDYLESKAGSINHCILITGVNINGDGKPDRWRMKNTYDTDGLHNGYFTCSDTWFDNFVFGALINKKYLHNYLNVYGGEPNKFEIEEII